MALFSFSSNWYSFRVFPVSGIPSDGRQAILSVLVSCHAILTNQPWALPGAFSFQAVSASITGDFLLGHIGYRGTKKGRRGSYRA